MSASWPKAEKTPRRNSSSRKGLACSGTLRRISFEMREPVTRIIRVRESDPWRHQKTDRSLEGVVELAPGLSQSGASHGLTTNQYLRAGISTSNGATTSCTEHPKDRRRRWALAELSPDVERQLCATVLRRQLRWHRAYP